MNIHFRTTITEQIRNKFETKIGQKRTNQTNWTNWTKHDKTRQNKRLNSYPLSVFNGKLFRNARQKKDIVEYL